jgi:anti-anti-sigma factor
VDGLPIAGLGDGANGKLIIFKSAKARHVRVSLVGDLDMTTAECLLDWAERLASVPPQALRLDASGLRFVDVYGIRSLTRACQLLQRRCGVFQLTGLPLQARRVAELTSTDLPALGVPAEDVSALS